MIRATTPRHVFYFQIDPQENFKRILISYMQNGKIVLEKEKEDLTFGEEPVTTDCGETAYTAWCRLTQNECNLFKANEGPVTLQIRVLTYEDEALATVKRSIQVVDVLNDEVLA